MSKLLRVLIIEDSEDDAELLVLELQRSGYQIIHQRVDTKIELHQALNNSQPWDIVLADYSMPQFNAIAALEVLRQEELDLPFIIVSGKIGEETAVAAMKAGAHDYLIKGNLARLIPAIERELREAILREEYRQAQTKLRYLAYYDTLTDLPNRILFLEHLERQLARCACNSPGDNPSFTLAVLILSVDRFNSIKQSLGYVLSRKLLTAIARRLESFMSDRENNILARLSADEFAILLTDIRDRQDALCQADRIYKCSIAPFEVQGSAFFSTVSIGIALGKRGDREPETLLQAADMAMQYAKANFVQRAVLFDENMHKTAVEKLQLETALQQAIDRQQLYLNYQPIVSLITGKVDCLEALVRWKHSSLGLIPPDKFIPLSEETGQIITLGGWVLERACRQLVHWQQNFSAKFPFSISINLSRVQIYHPELLLQIDNLLESLNLRGENIKLEITESTLMENVSTVTRVLEQLKERNIKLCIDDFGTGYSSLSYLRYLPVDTVKIDRSFIGTKIDRKNYDIVQAIVNLAHSLGLDVIAEGIETQTQLAMLRRLGCEYGQGYLFARPLSSNDVLQRMEPKKRNEERRARNEE
jgi:diguanylate cyclase (GGDEF)-like protein